MAKNEKKVSIMDLFGALKDNKDSISAFEKSFKCRKNLKLKKIKLKW
ncbi:hypothetical protein HYW20_06860 [Candidatus Woesearchaeota archaeon]|nr:hypothetical protein [Candidatus Woesearchaeota archaeon]